MSTHHTILNGKPQLVLCVRSFYLDFNNWSTRHSRQFHSRFIFGILEVTQKNTLLYTKLPRSDSMSFAFQKILYRKVLNPKTMSNILTGFLNVFSSFHTVSYTSKLVQNIKTKSQYFCSDL